MDHKFRTWAFESDFVKQPDSMVVLDLFAKENIMTSYIIMSV